MNKLFKERRWKNSLLILLLVLGLIILKELQEFISGFLGAFTLYVLMRKQLFFLTEKKKLKPALAAALLLVEAILFFLIPISLIFLMLADKVSVIDIDPQLILSKLNEWAAFIEAKTGVKVFTIENLSFLPRWGIATVQGIAQGAYSLVINSFVMIFVLYFLFIRAREFDNFLWDMLPFKRLNKRAIVNEANSMIHANAIGIPLLAFIQGIFAYIGYIIFDVHQAFFYAILTSFATIIPLLGTALVFTPLSIVMIMNGDLFNGVGLLLYGALVITNVDNLFRFILQKKLADIHPLITVFGVILGLKLFGFWGVIFGPLLLSLFILFLNIYRREYLTYYSNRSSIGTVALQKDKIGPEKKEPGKGDVP
ncbi:MAG: AI-2E family transporter [Candidatus Azobacteroides sp.]|nr:AI-2E family transporter [Candidatus Azobacteroides sp.]